MVSKLPIIWKQTVVRSRAVAYPGAHDAVGTEADPHRLKISECTPADIREREIAKGEISAPANKCL